MIIQTVEEKDRLIQELRECANRYLVRAREAERKVSLLSKVHEAAYTTKGYPTLQSGFVEQAFEEILHPEA